jgi:uncharacterized protein (DUF3084 family)
LNRTSAWSSQIGKEIKAHRNRMDYNKDFERTLKRLTKKGRRKAKEEVAKAFQKLVRLESADNDGRCQCITCGAENHYKKMHAGHWLSRKK